MPTPIEKLHKFLSLEIDRGYDNRAVVGGLDKILPAWESEARQNGVEVHQRNARQAEVDGLCRGGPLPHQPAEGEQRQPPGSGERPASCQETEDQETGQ